MQAVMSTYLVLCKWTLLQAWDVKKQCYCRVVHRIVQQPIDPISSSGYVVSARGCWMQTNNAWLLLMTGF